MEEVTSKTKSDSNDSTVLALVIILPLIPIIGLAMFTIWYCYRKRSREKIAAAENERAEEEAKMAELVRVPDPSAWNPKPDPRGITDDDIYHADPKESPKELPTPKIASGKQTSSLKNEAET